jgi:hypothetical protein
MKAAVIVCRDDNYGGNLHRRAQLCLDNLSAVFDRVYVVDWKSVNNITLLESMNYKKDNIIDIKITKDIISHKFSQTINYPIVESIGRNIGIRRAADDGVEWICSTNIDILMEPFDENVLDKNTLYTARKHHIPREKYQDPQFNFEDLKLQKETLQRAVYASRDGQALWDSGDIWSIAVGCGDFQLAHKTLWYDMKGFEEEMYGRSYADSNLMKRPILLGKNTSELNTGVYHLDHSNESFREPGETLPINDRFKYVNNFMQSTNTANWGIL